MIMSGSPGVRGRGIAINPAIIRIDPVTTLAAWTTLSIPLRYPIPPPRNFPRHLSPGAATRHPKRCPPVFASQPFPAPYFRLYSIL